MSLADVPGSRRWFVCFHFCSINHCVPAQVDINGTVIDIEQQVTSQGRTGRHGSNRRTAFADECSNDGETTAVPLIALAHGRSGDKGNHANIGIIARSPDYASLLREIGSPHRSSPNTSPTICREKLSVTSGRDLNAFNFLLRDVLGGGGMASLRYDPQGKTYAQMLLDIQIDDSDRHGWRAIRN